MDGQKRLLIFAFAVSIFLSPFVLADKPALQKEAKPVLIGRANPALKGIKTVVFYLTVPTAESDREALWSSLRKGVTNQLSIGDVGWHMPPAGAAGPQDLPALTIVVDMLKPQDSQQYVFSIQTALSSDVCLKDESSLCLKAELWKVDSKIQAVSEKNLNSAITGEVLRQVEAFTLAYQAANQAKAEKPIRYVASKKSTIFHKPDCIWAKRISAENLIGFATREEALKTGRRPCKRCNP